MTSPPSLAGLISLVQPQPLKTTVARVILQQFQDRILSTEGNRFFQGRYHLQGETGILYTSLNETIAIEEMKRHASFKFSQNQFVAAKINIQLQRVLDLTNPSNLKKLKIKKDMLTSLDFSITHAISLLARRDGFQGLLVPSATGLGDNLVVFVNNLGEGCSLSVEEINLC